jgi:hypothetical protein
MFQQIEQELYLIKADYNKEFFQVKEYQRRVELVNIKDEKLQYQRNRKLE